MLSPLAVSHAAVLRFIHATPDTTANAIAAATQRVPSNVRRDLPKLEKAGLITLEPLRLTDEAVAALAVIDGQAAPAAAQAPEGFAFRFHRQLRIGSLNPRKKFNPVTLDELMEDIADRGLSTNLEARADDPLPNDEGLPTNELVAGERRWRAIGKGIEQGRLDRDFPILVKVTAMDDGTHRVAALMENLQREGLTPLEEAAAFDDLMKTEGLTTAQLAARVKKSQKTVQNRIRLLSLPEGLQARMELPEDHDNHLGYKAALAGFLIQKREPVAAKEPAQPTLSPLSPKLALALVELADKAQRFPAKLHEPGFTEVLSMPRGGALATLHDRKIITFRETGGRTFVKILAHSSGALAWLEERGVYTNPELAIYQAQKAVLGGDTMAGLSQAGLYATAELNLPIVIDNLAFADGAIDPGDAVERTRSAPPPRPLVETLAAGAHAEVLTGGVNDDVLLVLRRGDVVHKHAEGATTFRLLDLKASGQRITFVAQPIRHGKDYGPPTSVDLNSIVGLRA